jgi:hypothetical protein
VQLYLLGLIGAEGFAGNATTPHHVRISGLASMIYSRVIAIVVIAKLAEVSIEAP